MSSLLSHTKRKPSILFVFVFSVFLVFILLWWPLNKISEYTSSDNYCMSCHTHSHVEEGWRFSAHYSNSAGIVVHCTQCHLAPKGEGHYKTKIKHGAKDIWSQLFKDHNDIDWEAKSVLAYAETHTYKQSCTKCHQNLFPIGLSVEGENAHLQYERSTESTHCIQCHLGVGHNKPDNNKRAFAKLSNNYTDKNYFKESTLVDSFMNYTEKIPGTNVTFNMIAIPGGEFILGSPNSEPYRNENEGPQVKVRISDFWMGEIEVTWNEYEAFFNATSSEGRNRHVDKLEQKTDAITGATSPWGAPDQSWGKGKRPAITMTHYAATVYCKWLSQITGKNYRLPTEAEWEYACRGGTSGAYFWEGNPKKYMPAKLFPGIFKGDTNVINSFVAYNRNSNFRTQEPAFVQPNPFGIKNLLGNVSEFCSDFYSEDIFKMYVDSVPTNPTGPKTGEYYVIRGGSFRDDASMVRCAYRTLTRKEEWLKTDPQLPKSKWWYSDCNHVGFRVVCNIDLLENKAKKNHEQKQIFKNKP